MTSNFPRDTVRGYVRCLKINGRKFYIARAPVGAPRPFTSRVHKTMTEAIAYRKRLLKRWYG